jgi:CheY-like chemotaxis protein
LGNAEGKELKMDIGKNECFDLPSLLKIDGLGLRNTANTYAMTVFEYFNILSEFLSLAPKVSLALSRYVARDGDADCYKNLDRMADLLKYTACDGFIETIYKTNGAYEQGNWKLAATYAKSMIDDFNAFYPHIEEAKRSNRPDIIANSELPLADYIKQLDTEEASRKLVILAVDDSHVILNSISSVLSDDYKVITLAKPAKLEMLLTKITPELFLLDYLMPEISGFDLIPIIRGLKEHKETPIVFLTSAGTIDTVTAALTLGACDFVVKPFNPDVLRDKIKKHITRKKAF